MVEYYSAYVRPEIPATFDQRRIAMKHVLFSALMLCCAAPAGAADFAEPVRLKGGEEFIRVEAPGWAAPCLADIDRDGKSDLLVGQFTKGKIRVYKGNGGGKFAAGTWLKAEGKVAEVPGVW
jgi:hypothetical protein